MPTLRNNLSKHRVFVQRLAAGQKQTIKEFLIETKKEALRLFKTRETIGVNSLKTLYKATAPIAQDMLAELKNVAQYEAEFVTEQYKQFINPDIKQPNLEKVGNRAIKNSMKVQQVKKTNLGYVLSKGNGTSLNAAYTKYSENTAEAFYQAIRDAKITGTTIDKLDSHLNELLNGRLLSQADTLSLTAVNHVTNIAKDEILLENSDLIAQEQWVTDLELNNCPICAGLSNEVRPAGEFEQPPLHWGCNCEVIPYVT